MRPPAGKSRTLLALCLLFGVAPTAASAQNSTQQELPDSPGAAIAQSTVEARPFQGQTSAASSASSQPSQVQAQSSPSQKPVGTAAAETPTTVGVAASNPSGAAIAPAKQRRVRTLFIKVGAIVGAGVALGTVAALSSASPSKPPGSH
jgi:hypothetical protein